MWTSDRNGHFFFSRSFISLLRSFFRDHRLSRSIIPVASSRSRFSAFISSPSLVSKAHRRKLTRSGHSRHSGGTSRKPLSPTGKTLCKTPKHAFFSIIRQPDRNTVLVVGLDTTRSLLVWCPRNIFHNVIFLCRPTYGHTSHIVIAIFIGIPETPY